MLLERIKALCAEKKMSIAALEREAGLGNATIRGWAESAPSATNLKRVCDVLGVSMDEIMDGIDNIKTEAGT